MPDPHGDLGALMRSWRDRLSPADVGLRTGNTRRAAGLRGEELAALAGLSKEPLREPVMHAMYNQVAGGLPADHSRQPGQLLLGVPDAVGELLMGVPSIPTTHHVPPCWVSP